MTFRKPVRLFDVGRKAYREVWELQHRVHAAVAAGHQADTWILTEHDPVITLGRNAKAHNVLIGRADLAAAGMDVLEIERGGDVTFHGPGQLVVYPIMKLERFREIVPLVRALEEAVIKTCSEFGVDAGRWDKHAGVWARENQLCAIGLAVRQMTSMHGIALNVCGDLAYDRLITPCGLPERGITSLSKESGRQIPLDEAKAALLRNLATTFNVHFEGQ